MSMQQYCLRWNNHQPNFISVFSSLLNNESLVDVTLSAEGRHLQAHKLVLSACSSYFQSLFTINPCQHPIVILKDVNFVDLKVMIDFMYYGEVNISQEQLPHILKTAELLKIKGLAEIPVDASVQAKTTPIGNSTTQQSTSVDRGGQTTATELLSSTGDNGSATVSSWSTGQDSSGLVNLQRQSISPGIVTGGVSCPLSPSSRRKRLRKSSTSTDSSNRQTQSLSQQTSLTQQLDLTTSDPTNSNVTSHPSPLHLHLPHHTLPILHPLHHHASSHSHHSHHSSQQHQIASIVNSDGSGAMSPMAATTTSGVSGGGSSGGSSSTTTTVTSIKPDPGESSASGSYGDGNNGVKYEQLQVQQQQQQQPVELLHRVSSHDSGNGGGDSSGSGHSPHQITLQIPSQEINQPTHTIETSSIDLPGSSSTSSQPDRMQIVQSSSATQPTTTSNQSPPVLLHLASHLISTSPPLGGTSSMATMGTKRCRFLKRQSRVKRELDTSNSDPIHPHLYHQHSSEHYERYGNNLTVPHRVERQVSDPLPVSGQGSPPPHGGRMLTVPGTAILVKQHSHPLLPSQQSQPYHQISSPPIQHSTSSSSHSTQTIHTSTSTEPDLTSSGTGPPVIFIDSLTSTHITATGQHDASGAHATATLRVRTDELKRSASSPAQTSAARSSHCPVVRSGPALGCNYCWNTVDTHGRILRRKTKYHCPECQTNLCIVPCFQEYHERHSSGGGASGAGSDALILTQSVMRVFPKTSSM